MKANQQVINAWSAAIPGMETTIRILKGAVLAADPTVSAGFAIVDGLEV